MSIRREIEVTRKGLTRQIDVTYGTNILPIKFIITDFELPEGATAEVYAMGASGKLVKQSCVISKNIISFTPEIGLFEEGKNVLQLVATHAGKDLFSFYIPVNCQKTMVYEGAQDLENDPTFVAMVMQMKEDIANKITIPEAAEVGQILEVEEVDENGKPIKFIAVDKPTGSGEGGAGAVELTQEEYDNLSEEEKMKDVIYFITDGVEDEEERTIFINETGEFTASTSLVYTGCKITIPANSAFNIWAFTHFTTCAQKACLLSLKEDDISAWFVLARNDNGHSVSFSGYTPSEITIYLHASYLENNKTCKYECHGVIHKFE